MSASDRRGAEWRTQSHLESQLAAMKKRLKERDQDVRKRDLHITALEFTLDLYKRAALDE